MTPEKLQEMYYYAWDTFYSSSDDYALRMSELFRQVIMKEMADGTYVRPERTRKTFERQILS